MNCHGYGSNTPICTPNFTALRRLLLQHNNQTIPPSQKTSLPLDHALQSRLEIRVCDSETILMMKRTMP